jgi:hypothetical protein
MNRRFAAKSRLAGAETATCLPPGAQFARDKGRVFQNESRLALKNMSGAKKAKKDDLDA